MFERVCDRDPRSVDRCRKVLHWCVAARRLLTVDELLLALAVSEGVSSHQEYDAETDRSDSQRVFRLECGSLIHVLKDNTVQLLHTSLHEYLVHQDVPSIGERLPVSTMQVANVHLVHRDLAIICLRYNLFACFKEYIDMGEVELYKKCFPLSEYAISKWIYHDCSSGDSHSSLSNALGEFLDSNQGWRWLHRCEDFNITRGHLQVFQRALKVWNDQSCSSQRDRRISDQFANFILHLLERRCKDLCDEGGEQLADAELRLGMFYGDFGRSNKELNCYNRALDGFLEALGNNHPSTLRTVKNVGCIYAENESFGNVIQWYERALAGFETALGKEHPSTTRDS